MKSMFLFVVATFIAFFSTTPSVIAEVVVTHPSSSRFERFTAMDGVDYVQVDTDFAISHTYGPGTNVYLFRDFNAFDGTNGITGVIKKNGVIISNPITYGFTISYDRNPVPSDDIFVIEVLTNSVLFTFSAVFPAQPGNNEVLPPWPTFGVYEQVYTNLPFILRNSSDESLIDVKWITPPEQGGSIIMQVPEPKTWVLISFGLIGLVAHAIQRRNRQSG